MSDRRRFDRIQIQIPVTVSSTIVELTVEGYTVNLSASGAAIAFDESLLQTGDVEVRFLEGELQEVELRGRVVWVKGTAEGVAMGIHFLDVTEEQLGALCGFLYAGTGAAAPPGLKTGGSGAFLTP